MLTMAPLTAKPRKSVSKCSLIARPFKIGQLDGSAPRQPEIRVVKRRASIELIAEQYQALLESRDDEDEETSSDEEFQEGVLLLQPTRFEPEERPVERDHVHGPLQAAAQIEPSGLSPASDGTFVDFEEDAIYFKPISFDPEPSPPSEPCDYDKPLPMTPPEKKKPLRACLSLLVDNITSEVQPQPGNNMKALQISAMINMYENLRHNIKTADMDESEREAVRSMFDCWLAALHAVHLSCARDSSNNQDRGRP
jgi:hypothetical protein